MKILTLVLLLSTASFAAEEKCSTPEGKYTDLASVLKQFPLRDGNPNWGDWCYEVLTKEQSKECNAELDAWDNWLDCAGLGKYRF